MVSQSAVAASLEALHGLMHRCSAPVMIPDLFPDLALELICIPAGHSTPCTLADKDHALHVPAAEPGVTLPALAAIGGALLSELETSRNDMVRYETDDGVLAIAYLPTSRMAVLQATGLVLLPS